MKDVVATFPVMAALLSEFTVCVFVLTRNVNVSPGLAPDSTRVAGLKDPIIEVTFVGKVVSSSATIIDPR